MPVPALIGIPWLGGLLTTIVGSFTAFWSLYLGKKLGGIVGVLLAVAAAFSVFYAAIASLLIGITASMPPVLGEGIALIMPTNAIACVSAVITAKIARAVYSYQLFISGQLSFKF